MCHWRRCRCPPDCTWSSDQPLHHSQSIFLGPPVERLEYGCPIFFVVSLSRGTLPRKRVKGHYWGTESLRWTWLTDRNMELKGLHIHALFDPAHEGSFKAFCYEAVVQKMVFKVAAEQQDTNTKICVTPALPLPGIRSANRSAQKEPKQV